MSDITRYTPESLKDLGNSLMREPMTALLGERLLCMADDWEVSLRALSPEPASKCVCELVDSSREDSWICTSPEYQYPGPCALCHECGHDRDCHPASQPSNTGETK